MNISKLKDALMNPKSILSEENALVALSAMNYEGLTLAETRQKTSLSYAKARRIIIRLESEGFITRDEIPHKHQNMPATYVYYLSSDLPLDEVRRLCRQYLQEKKDASQSSYKYPHVTTASLVAHEGDPSYKPGQLINICLRELRQASREDHLKVLQALARIEEATMIDIAEDLGVLRQTIHARLSRLGELGLVKRSSGRGEKGYAYFLSKNITLSDKDWLLKFPTQTQNTLDIEGTGEAVAPKHASTPNNSRTSQPSPQNLPGLPEFNEAWPDDLKKQWFELYARMLDKKES